MEGINYLRGNQPTAPSALRDQARKPVLCELGRRGGSIRGAPASSRHRERPTDPVRHLTAATAPDTMAGGGATVIDPFQRTTLAVGQPLHGLPDHGALDDGETIPACGPAHRMAPSQWPNPGACCPLKLAARAGGHALRHGRLDDLGALMRPHTRTTAALTSALLMAAAGCSDSSNTTGSNTSGQSSVRQVEVPAATSKPPP